ncbi:hypothetical protein TL16_g12100 [Triparma laevis f. inornata]|uniref:Uncharacterized protein n=1 Tax=Triparma laevis f. inornata TaxID=1714386 RepID=A0A9W7BQK2_9STRA|nr:hypothetical protein TL16_g12100 [Triparma laevis f. inornata]
MTICLSSFQPVLTLHAALEELNPRTNYGYKKFEEFWDLTLAPLSFGAMAISFLLKPRRNGWKYKAILYTQYFIYGYGKDIVYLAASRDLFPVFLIVKAMIWIVLLIFGQRVRSGVADLPGAKMSHYLTHVVLKGGFFVGLAQLSFLIFSSIQCEGDEGSYHQCSRTLYSQTGLGIMVVLYLSIKIVTGLVPDHILDRHIVSVEKVVALDLNLEEKVQAVGLSIAAASAMFMLGNYGAKGDFRSEAERTLLSMAGVVGSGSLIVTSLWKMIVIRGEMKREAEQGVLTAENAASSSSPPTENLLKEASLFWYYAGVIATSLYSALCIAGAVVMDDSFTLLVSFYLPFVILIYIGAVFCRPRRKSPMDMWKLRVHFMSFAYISEVSTKCMFEQESLGAQGFLTLVTGLCGIFLFSMMEAEEKRPESNTLIYVVGFIGLASSTGSVVSETYSSLKAQRKRIKLSQSGENLPEQADDRDKPVDECSWVFVLISVIFTSAYSILYIFYGLTLNSNYEMMVFIILPMAGTSFVMGIVMKPKRTDSLYKRFLYCHFVSFLIVAEVPNAVAKFHKGYLITGAMCIIRIPLWWLMFSQVLKLRKAAAQLPPLVLSEYLCETVLKKGTQAMGPMIFFTFETVSCFISQNSLDNGQCKNTSRAAMFLSAYLTFLTIWSMSTKAVPKIVQKETAWEYTSVATLSLTWRQRLQGGLLVVTAFSSLYLLSCLGVEGEKNNMVSAVGGSGALSLGIAVLIGMATVTKSHDIRQGSGLSEQQEDGEEVKSKRSISVDEIGDGMALASFV